jgi:hypothetical protein
MYYHTNVLGLKMYGANAPYLQTLKPSYEYVGILELKFDFSKRATRWPPITQ